MKSVISSKGQITVPVGIRSQLGLKPGTVVTFEMTGDGALMRKGRTGVHPVEHVYGMLRSKRRTNDLLDELRGPRRGAVRSAVDSSVLLDVLLPDPQFGPASAELLRRAIDAGPVIACDVVWTEVRASFPGDAEFDDAMNRLGIEFDSIGAAAAAEAGSLWRQYRKAKTARSHLIPDFLIGAHAQFQADVLLSRDRGFYRHFFATLKISDPSK